MIWMVMMLCVLPQDRPPAEKIKTQEKDFVTYAKARELHKELKVPIVIVVTAPYCQYCPKMKNELRLFKKEYPMVVLTEMHIDDAKKIFDFVKENAVPQTFMFAWDNLEQKQVRTKVLIGSTTKQRIYQEWGIPER